MLDIPYDKQLRLKEEELKSLLDLGNFEGVYASPQTLEYRNKMEFSFGDEYKGGPLALGMHRRNSFHDIVSAGHCQLVDADFRRILSFALDYFGQRYLSGSSANPNAAEAPEPPYSYYHRRRHKGYLRHLLVRKATRGGGILVALVTSSQETHNLDEWKEGLLALELAGTVGGILHIINDSVADVVRPDMVVKLYGQDYIHESVCDLRFKISPFSFFQTNTAAAELLYEKVRAYVKSLPADPVIFDLYCGTGTIAILLASLAKTVIGMEIVAEAIAAARENAAINVAQNCEFIAADVLVALDGLAQKPDIIVLDPPRAGLHPKALKKIIAHDAPHIIYISCKAASFARELPAFKAAGYELQQSAAIDLFPATKNVELVCLLEAKKP